MYHSGHLYCEFTPPALCISLGFAIIKQIAAEMYHVPFVCGCEPARRFTLPPQLTYGEICPGRRRSIAPQARARAFSPLCNARSARCNASPRVALFIVVASAASGTNCDAREQEFPASALFWPCPGRKLPPLHFQCLCISGKNFCDSRQGGSRVGDGLPSSVRLTWPARRFLLFISY